MTKQPRIGIWWDNGKTIASFLHLPQKPERETGLCDSEYNHNDLWPDAALQFGIVPDAEYFSVPRGRVFWDAQKRQSIIYHGNATTKDRLKMISKAFGLSKWISKQDIHYAMGGAADMLFEDDL